MSEPTPIPTEALIAARRRMKHRVLAAIINAMADADVDVETMAARLGRPPASLYRWMRSLLDGSTRDLDIISDMCLALGGEMVFRLEPLPSPAEYAAEQAVDLAPAEVA